ncbi:MAG: xanthine dehydrogenase family protein [Pseudomonadota bacterium]
MSALRKIARRTFLIGSVAVAGGVAFGSYQIRRPHDNPLLDDLPDGAASFNPWVRIDTEAVTLITPHADLGQGVAHMQALLIAEELDLAENGFRTEFGLPAAAYYNRAFGSEAGADLAAVTPLPAAFLENAINTVAKLTGLQGTGGSTSVPDSFDKLREAGAVARETLKAAASAETGIPVPDLRTEAGEVVLPDGTAIPYTALAARAATIAPVTDVRLRDPGAWTMLGRPTHRLDIDAKSRGQQSYGIDLDMPGMVYASVKLSPRRSAVVDYDAGAAEGRRGVQAIFEIDGGVAVVANNTWRAIEAARAITLTTEPAAYPADQDGHWQVLSESFTDAHLDAVWRDDGDLDAATGDTVVTAEYRAPYVAHQPLEPLNAVALVTDSTITIWAAQQMPTLVKQIAAAGTDHDPDQVIFHNQYSGGSFGHRLEMDVVRQAVAIADQMRGTPVKLTYSREEDFAQDYPRGIAMARGHATLEGDRITGVALDIAAPSVIASQAGRSNLPISGPDSQITAGAFNAPYNFDAFRVRGFRAP